MLRSQCVPVGPGVRMGGKQRQLRESVRPAVQLQLVQGLLHPAARRPRRDAIGNRTSSGQLFLFFVCVN